MDIIVDSTDRLAAFLSRYRLVLPLFSWLSMYVATIGRGCIEMMLPPNVFFRCLVYDGLVGAATAWPVLIPVYLAAFCVVQFTIIQLRRDLSPRPFVIATGAYVVLTVTIMLVLTARDGMNSSESVGFWLTLLRVYVLDILLPVAVLYDLVALIHSFRHVR